MGRFLCWIVLLALCGCATVVQAAKRPAKPPAASATPTGQAFLRLETGSHTAKINRIAVDAAGQFLVTGSNDKTARVWRLTDGVLLQTLRPPLGDGNEGNVYAVAIAPDGGIVAVGGFMSPQGEAEKLYLFDRATGRLLHTISGLPDAIDDLSFSRDGHYLAAGLGSNGLHVYRSKDWQEVARDVDYQDRCESVDFDTAGRLLTTSLDGFIRLYDAAFRLLTKRKASGGNQPFRARFSPDGSKIAVGFIDSTAVNLLSGQDLNLLYAPDTRLADNGALYSVAWSTDGSLLYAGGRYIETSSGLRLLRWAEAGRGHTDRFRVSTDILMDLRPLADGRLAFGTGNPLFGVLNRDGGKRWERGADFLDLRGSIIDKLRVSEDGSQLEFSFDTYAQDFTRQQHRVYFDLTQRQPRFDPPPANGLTAPNTEGEPRINWYDTEHPQIHGQPLAVQPYEHSWSLALSPQAPGFLLGTEWWLRYYDSPQQLRWAAPVPSVAIAVNLSADGRYAIAAYADGTIRWHKTADGEEVLALFVHPDGQRWIMWTKEGFYDAAPGAESLIGYHLNQGREREGRFVAAAQLERRFFRPDLIAHRLSPEGDKLVADAAAKLGDVWQTLRDGLPPALELVSSHLDGFDLVLEYRVQPQNGGVGRIVYKINGVEQEARALAITTPGSKLPLKISLPLPAGQVNNVEMIAYNGRNSIASQPLVVTQTTPAAAVKPTLYVLAVGVSQYKDPGMSLKYAAADAQAVSAMLAQRGKALFDIAAPKILLDGQANRSGIQAAFAELAGQVKENDVFLLYLAGHGAVFDGAYHFVPQDDIYRSEKNFRAASLNQQDFQDLLKTIRAQKSLILLDTCYAGAVKLAALASGLAVRGDLEEKTAITKLMRATGRTVLMASSDKTMALEGYKDHGFFTYALLQGLQGAADSNHNDEISTLELADFVSDLVPKISKDKQFPIHESNGNAFPIGYTR